MDPEDKVLLLSEFVPLFGTTLGDAIIKEIIPILEATLKIVKLALPNASAGDVQLISVCIYIVSFFVFSP